MIEPSITEYGVILKSKSEKQKPPICSSLNQLIEELHAAFSEDSVNVEYIHELMSSYKSNPLEWRKFAKFDRYRYTRNLVDEGNGKFNLMILCWGEGHASAIHDHANAHCFMKMLHGQLEEIRFAWPDEDDKTDIPENEKGLNELSRTNLKTNQVCYINDSMGLHRVENPSHSDTAVSLHLYCPPFDACQVFNQRTGQKSKCKVTFWSKFGTRKNADDESCRQPEDV
ncbi:cysteine dioxygenase type 1 [Nilaparvata lugens]|uniref:cysteine dioxygenase type 1 n=1 Tax=Nilaparvata lugens TaxID=108931 RepID=UPI000B99A2FE|nr:cysteine dioxygenase type 1 [Nilaparvata lugens]XP_022188522.1 cysteine dioxygenase type 1 [Nilaparvata lugens]XP_039299038.1 cysteine dioxygenase type 1 [Nilaparvata lugens]XP_039299039.1 cysteine dioxygenase type 1 [Nilaparvata lugens]